jgi:dihydrofolate reductase
MSKVIADITMSLDGFVTARDPDAEHGLGVGGEVLHRWVFEGNDEDQRILDASVRTGAVIMGRNLFDIVDGPDGWNDELGYGAEVAAKPPVFVVTHHAPGQVRLVDQMHIVTDGLHSALTQARAAAGDKPVVIMGGGAIINAALAAGIVDELVLHVAPVVLGKGTPLFGDDLTVSLELVASVSTPFAQHLTYRVLPA